MGARLTVRDSARMTNLQKLQEKAPKVLQSLDAKLKLAPVAAGDAGRARWGGVFGRRRFLFRENAIRVSVFSGPVNDPH
jgi:hypothetical protein